MEVLLSFCCFRIFFCFSQAGRVDLRPGRKRPDRIESLEFPDIRFGVGGMSSVRWKIEVVFLGLLFVIAILVPSRRLNIVSPRKQEPDALKFGYLSEFVARDGNLAPSWRVLLRCGRTPPEFVHLPAMNWILSSAAGRYGGTFGTGASGATGRVDQLVHEFSAAA